MAAAGQARLGSPGGQDDCAAYLSALMRGQACGAPGQLRLGALGGEQVEQPLKGAAHYGWMELEDFKHEWASFTQAVEDHLHDHFRRQEMLMSQHTHRVETLVAGGDCHSTGRSGESAGAVPKKATVMAPFELPAPMSEGNFSDKKGHFEEKPCTLVVPEQRRNSSSLKPSRPHIDATVPTYWKDVAAKQAIVDASGLVLPPCRDLRGEAWEVRVSSPAEGELEASPAASSKVSFRQSRSGSHSCAKINSLLGGELAAAQEQKVSRGRSLRSEQLRSTIGEPTWAVCGSWIDKWLELQEPEPTSRLAKFVDGKWFELMCAVVIIFNSVLTVQTTNYEASSLTEDNSSAIRLANVGFACFYLLELLIRIWVHKFYFFCNADMAWNIFDTLLVMLALYDTIASEVLLADSVNMNHMRTMRAPIRIIRMAKVLRMFRLVRFFAELRLLLISVLWSMVSLFWSIVMLVFMFFIFSLIFVQGATTTLISHHEGHTRLSQEEVHYLQSILGSTQAGILMLFKSATGGEDWTRYYDAVVLTGDGNCALFLFFISFAQFALLNILTGIFVENAVKLAQPDRDVAALRQRKKEMLEAEELRRLCRSMDTMNTGFISEDQFMAHLQNDQFKARLALLGLDIKHAALFFDVVSSDFDRKDMEIEAFVSGAMRLKGLASSLDLQALTVGTKIIQDNQTRYFRALEARLSKLTDHVDKLCL